MKAIGETPSRLVIRIIYLLISHCFYDTHRNSLFIANFVTILEEATRFYLRL